MGSSVRMRELYAELEQLVRSDAAVLIQVKRLRQRAGGGRAGQHGPPSGRAPGGRRLREAPPDADRECAVWPRQGAFTGATEACAGAFHQANRRDVVPRRDWRDAARPAAQALRALETQEIRRLGGDRSIPVDVRVLSATHRDLEREMNQAPFVPTSIFDWRRCIFGCRRCTSTRKISPSWSRTSSRTFPTGKTFRRRPCPPSSRPSTRATFESSATRSNGQRLDWTWVAQRQRLGAAPRRTKH